MEKGKLIVVEGACDGMGKTTQYTLLGDRLESEGKKVVKHHFPSYDTYQGKPVEKYLSGEFGSPKDLSPYFVNSLYAIDRAITWNTELKDEYDSGSTILLDRYTTSSIIYQSALIEDENERRRFIDYICDFEYNKLGIQIPDNIIFLHAPFELVTRMRQQRTVNDGVVNDIHERDIDFMKKVYDNAMFISRYLGWDMVDCEDKGKMDTVENIHEKVYQKINK